MQSPSRRDVFLVAGAIGGMLTQTASGLAQDNAPATENAGPKAALAAGLTLALAGDALITRRLSPYTEPRFQALIDLLRSCDAAFTNLEMSLNDYEVYPAVQSGGQHLAAPPEIAKELYWAGFRIASLANNHAADWGVPGMQLTKKYAREAGLIVAGTGESLAAAREAAFLETGRGRVSLVAAASTFTVEAPAGSTRGDIRPRPGLSPLRFSTTQVVTAETMSGLRALAPGLGASLPTETDRLQLLGKLFVAGPEPGVPTRPHPQDLEEITASVSDASRLSDVAIVSVHTHESEGMGRDIMVSTEHPPAFLKLFARAAIDSGAAVVVSHGPHKLRGIEIYNGKPIFYSLGNFIFQNETLRRIPEDDYELANSYLKAHLGADAGVADFDDVRYNYGRVGFPAHREYWESIVPVLRWRDGRLASVDLHPITLGFGLPEDARGRPLLAEGELARKILADVQRMSVPFGTRIIEHDGIGSVVLGT